LAEIKLIYRLCHHVHHFGRLQTLVEEGLATDVDMDAVIDHWSTVNKVPREDFQAYYDAAVLEWATFSQIDDWDKWDMDYGPYDEIVEKAETSFDRWATRSTPSR
jgi:hypothetical protein